MSKQSNQRYRKEREKEIFKKQSSDNKVSNSYKEEPNKNNKDDNMNN